MSDNNTPHSGTDLPVIGILGDGQLSMMMVDAYHELGGRVYVLGETADGPASHVADRLIVGDPSKLKDLIDFYREVDIVTLENEFYDSRLLSQASVESETPVYPDPNRFGLIEDKLSEKRFFENQGVNVADFFEVLSEDDLVDAPGYLKLAKGGYDGIGTYKVKNKDAALAVYKKIESAGAILFEHAVDFKKELSLIAVANEQEVVVYPLVETHQEDGTCRYVSYPAGVSADIEKDAREQVTAIMKGLNTRGLFAFELFLTQDEQLILNESAPRPHNSGHITMDLMDCSQFENHMRSVAGMTMLTPKPLYSSMTMLNLLGTRDGAFEEQTLIDQVNDPESGITLYRKLQSRVKRKMGHINVWGDQHRERAEKLVERLEV